MSESVRALLHGSIDFAGTEPPAALSLKQSLRNYIHDIQEPEGWIIGRLVCPIKQLRSLKSRARKLRRVSSRPLSTNPRVKGLRYELLETLGLKMDSLNALDWLDSMGADSLDIVELVMELEEEFDLGVSGGDPAAAQSLDELVTSLQLDDLVAAIQRETAHRVSVSGNSGSNAREFLSQLHSTVKLIADFQTAHSKYARIDALELTLPHDAMSANESMASVLEQVSAAVAELQLSAVYFEVPRREPWRAGVTRLLKGLRDFAAEGFGLHLRVATAGEEPLSLDQVAFLLGACRIDNVIWKASSDQGQPLCHKGGKSSGKTGFLNLLAAGALASTHQLDHEQLVSVLEETSLAQLRFNASGLAWRGLRVSVDDIAQWRSQSGASFACSRLDETRDGLRDLLLIA